ncbi:MAG TPA: YihY/virulence factor BrkB family protein [Terriglobales bacterium]|nr:YihY/virulence factor BrkB family protein [Terriglobales bacterium]
MRQFFRLCKRALAHAWEHDVFGIAKAAAYSGIITLFPAMLVLAAILATSRQHELLISLVTRALWRILPSGTAAAAISYFTSNEDRPIPLLVMTSVATLWTASGMMVSLMEGFRQAYSIPKTWGAVHERLIAIYLVLLAFLPMTFATGLVAFGTQTERWVVARAPGEFHFYILVAAAGGRWFISALTSVAVLVIIYHYAVPRTQPWHSVVPGAALATVLWFAATLTFGFYLQHVSEYSLVYGSVGVAITLMIWMYLVSLIVLFGAEFNALIFPRAVLEMRQQSAE